MRTIKVRLFNGHAPVGDHQDVEAATAQEAAEVVFGGSLAASGQLGNLRAVVWDHQAQPPRPQSFFLQVDRRQNAQDRRRLVRDKPLSLVVELGRRVGRRLGRRPLSAAATAIW
jgi:hypothetical protein